MCQFNWTMRIPSIWPHISCSVYEGVSEEVQHSDWESESTTDLPNVIGSHLSFKRLKLCIISFLVTGIKYLTKTRKGLFLLVVWENTVHHGEGGMAAACSLVAGMWILLTYLSTHKEAEIRKDAARIQLPSSFSPFLNLVPQLLRLYHPHLEILLSRLPFLKTLIYTQRDVLYWCLKYLRI